MSRNSPPKIFFNASVILAGLKNPSGGSGKLLEWVKSGKIRGVISDLVLQETMRHAGKIGLDTRNLEKIVQNVFPNRAPAPDSLQVEKYVSFIADSGDVHIFASCQATTCDMLVSLDKKHILALAGKIQEFTIVSPKQLIEKLQK